jgi:hypothetical protein
MCLPGPKPGTVHPIQSRPVPRSPGIGPFSGLRRGFRPVLSGPVPACWVAIGLQWSLVQGTSDAQIMWASCERTAGVVGRRCLRFEQPPLRAPPCRYVRSGGVVTGVGLEPKGEVMDGGHRSSGEPGCPSGWIGSQRCSRRPCRCDFGRCRFRCRWALRDVCVPTSPSRSIGPDNRERQPGW